MGCKDMNWINVFSGMGSWLGISDIMSSGFIILLAVLEVEKKR
jgi:hypothetical protein